MVFRTCPTCQGYCLKLQWLCRTHETLWKFVPGSLFEFCGRMSSKRCEPLQLWPWQHWLRCGRDKLLSACHSFVLLQLSGRDALWHWGLRYGATTVVEGFLDGRFVQQTLWLIDLTCVCVETSLCMWLQIEIHGEAVDKVFGTQAFANTVERAWLHSWKPLVSSFHWWTQSTQTTTPERSAGTLALGSSLYQTKRSPCAGYDHLDSRVLHSRWGDEEDCPEGLAHFHGSCCVFYLPSLFLRIAAIWLVLINPQHLGCWFLNDR